ncbi:hypothetical protein J3F84DRAFT_391154 [Trichoderma pleuroticola]
MKKLKVGVVEGKANDTQESSQEPIGYELSWHTCTIPAIFFLVLGLLFHYYYGNSLNKMLLIWRELVLALN